MAERDLHAELDTIKADMAKLRVDVAELGDILRELGAEKIGGARESVADEVRRAREELDRRFQSARQRGRKAAEDVEHAVEEHPFSSLVTAFGIGFIVSRLLDGGGRR